MIFLPGRIGARCPRFLERWLPAGHDRTMAELWKIDESDGKVRVFPGLALAGPKWHCPRRFPGWHPARPAWRCRSSVVEHVLGKDGVGSSILLGSTTSLSSADRPQDPHAPRAVRTALEGSRPGRAPRAVALYRRRSPALRSHLAPTGAYPPTAGLVRSEQLVQFSDRTGKHRASRSRKRNQ
jgi:hypothetical protein